MAKPQSQEFKYARYQLGFQHRRQGLKSQFSDKWYRLGFRDGNLQAAKVNGAVAA